jgi:tetratricopeptide (TPR) repeat protein
VSHVIDRFREGTRQALVARRREDPAAALRAIRAMRRMLPDDAALAQLALAAGECYEALDEIDLARREYELAVSLDPSLDGARARCDALADAESAARSVAASILAAGG